MSTNNSPTKTRTVDSGEFSIISPSRAAAKKDLEDEDEDFFLDGDDFAGIEGFGDLEQILNNTAEGGTTSPAEHNADLFATIRSRLKSNAMRNTGTGGNSTSSPKSSSRSVSLAGGRSRLKSVLVRVSAAAKTVHQMQASANAAQAPRSGIAPDESAAHFLRSVHVHIDDAATLAAMLPSIAVDIVKAPVKLAEFVKAGLVSVLLEVLEKHMSDSSIVDAACAALVLSISRSRIERENVSRLLRLRPFTHAIAEVVGEIIFYHPHDIDFARNATDDGVAMLSSTADPRWAETTPGTHVELIIAGVESAIPGNDYQVLSAFVRISDSILRIENNATGNVQRCLWKTLVELFDWSADWLLTAADVEAQYAIASGLERIIENVVLSDTPIPLQVTPKFVQTLFRFVTSTAEIDVRDAATSAFLRVVEQTDDGTLTGVPLPCLVDAALSLFDDLAVCLWLREWPIHHRHMQDAMLLLMQMCVRSEVIARVSTTTAHRVLHSLNASLRHIEDAPTAVEPALVSSWCVCHRTLSLIATPGDSASPNDLGTLILLARDAAARRMQDLVSIALSSAMALVGGRWGASITSLATSTPATPASDHDYFATTLPILVGDVMLDIIARLRASDHSNSPLIGAVPRNGKGNIKANAAAPSQIVHTLLAEVIHDMAAHGINPAYFSAVPLDWTMRYLQYLLHHDEQRRGGTAIGVCLDQVASPAAQYLTLHLESVTVMLQDLLLFAKASADDHDRCSVIAAVARVVSVASAPDTPNEQLSALLGTLLNVLSFFISTDASTTAHSASVLRALGRKSWCALLRARSAAQRALLLAQSCDLPIVSLCYIALIVSYCTVDDVDAAVLEANVTSSYVFDAEAAARDGPFNPLNDEQRAAVDECRDRVAAIQRRREDERQLLLALKKENDTMRERESTAQREHAARVAALERERDDAAQALSATQRDLEGEKKASATLQTALDEALKALEGEKKETARVQQELSTMQRDIEAERESWQRERSAFVTEINQRKSTIDELAQSNAALEQQLRTSESRVEALERDFATLRQASTTRATSPNQSTARHRSPRDRDAALARQVKQLQAELHEARHQLENQAHERTHTTTVVEPAHVSTAEEFVAELELLRTQLDHLDPTALRDLKQDCLTSRIELETYRSAINNELELAAARVHDVMTRNEFVENQLADLQIKADTYDILKMEFDAATKRFDQSLHQRKHDDAAHGQEAGATKTVQRLSLALIRISDLEREIKRGIEERADLQLAAIESQRKAAVAVMIHQQRAENTKWATARSARLEREAASLRSRLRVSERRFAFFKRRCEQELLTEADALHKRCAELAFDRDKIAATAAEMEEQLQLAASESKRRARSRRGLPSPTSYTSTSRPASAANGSSLTIGKSPAARANSAARIRAAQRASAAGY